MADFTQKPKYNMQDLLDIMRILRAPGGCPWDREQTHESIRMNFVEETYEVLDAIDQQDAVLMCEELGDVLLQVAFHCQIEQEKGTFTFEDACDGICKKMIYRHPHIFGNETIHSTDEVLNIWDQLKNKAKGRTTAKADLESVPRGMPALMRAHKVQKRAGGYGIARPDTAAAVQDLEHQLDALKQAISGGEDLRGQIGDLLFSAVSVARLSGVDAEQELGFASDRFTGRVVACEELARQQGKDLKQLTEDELDTLWLQAKQMQSAGE